MPWTLSRSWWLKLFVMALAAMGFIVVYERVMMDSRDAVVDSTTEAEPPVPGRKVRFEVTAYCKGETTASGIRVRAGIAAADPKQLPPGSVIKIEGIPSEYVGVYTVLDTGPAVQGRILDIYMWSCFDALDFGRRKASVTVLRSGWDPKTSAK